MSDYARDMAATATVFGFFAVSWFGWAREDPPHSWQRPLVVLMVAASALCLAGGVLTWRLWSTGTALDAVSAPRFGIVVGIEFALAGAGAGVLAALRRAEFISAWIAFVVGVHFLPLAAILDFPALVVPGVAIPVWVVAAVLLARARGVAVSALAGSGTGAVLLVTGLLSLAAAVAATG
ncbi:MAG: hypothetical protein ACFCVG_08570 [Kineosporiaceae bacterium]